MNKSYFNIQEDRLRARYRMLMREAEKISELNPGQAKSRYAEAEMVLNKLNLVRSKRRFINYRYNSHY